MEHPGRVREHRHAEHHVADLADRAVGDRPFEVGHGQRHGGREHERRGADDRAHVGGRRGLLEERVHAGDQVHARGDHRGRVDQGRDRSRSFHRVGEPGVQRQLRGLGERADQDQQARGHERAVVVAEGTVGLAEDARVVERPRLVEHQERRHHEADVADHVDHERLDPGAGGGLAPVPVRDQQVGGRADERPADDQQHEVGRQHQQQHREDEVVEVGEVARVAAIAAHVGDRVDVDQERHAADHQAHEHRQRVDEDRHVDLEVARRRVGPGRVDQRPCVLGLVLQLYERADRGEEGAQDRAARDPTREPRRQPAGTQPAEADQERAGQRERQDQPAVRSGAHPRSSDISSTSIGSRLRYIATMIPRPITTSQAAITITISANT